MQRRPPQSKVRQSVRVVRQAVLSPGLGDHGLVSAPFIILCLRIWLVAHRPRQWPPAFATKATVCAWSLTASIAWPQIVPMWRRGLSSGWLTHLTGQTPSRGRICAVPHGIVMPSRMVKCSGLLLLSRREPREGGHGPC